MDELQVGVLWRSRAHRGKERREPMSSWESQPYCPSLAAPSRLLGGKTRFLLLLLGSAQRKSLDLNMPILRMGP